MRKVIDCFPFYNELKMLEFRLLELNDVVDYFLIIEARQTYSGGSKELNFEKNKHLFEQYLDKIIYVVVDIPNTRHMGVRDGFQKNCITQELRKLNLNSEDIITITDADEIPDTQTLKQAKENGLDKIYCLEQVMYFYNLQCQVLDPWVWPKIMNYGSLQKIGSVQGMRYGNYPKLSKGGWHFNCFFDDLEKIKNKIRGFIHQEYNTPYYLNDERLKECIRECKSFFHGGPADKGSAGGHRNFQKILLADNNYLPQHHEFWLQDGLLMW